MVDDAVNHGGGNGDIAEALRPLGKRQVGRDNDGAVFVPAGGELKEEVRGVGLDRDVAEFVDDEQGPDPCLVDPGSLGGVWTDLGECLMVCV